MYAEVCKAIVRQYNLITYDGGLLKDTAPIYFGIAPEEHPYPFTNFWFLPSNVDFTFCTDLHGIPIQFSIFDNINTPAQVLLISDAIYDGFNDVLLTDLDGSQVRVDPLSVQVIQQEDQSGHMGIVNFKYIVQKIRS